MRLKKSEILKGIDDIQKSRFTVRNNTVEYWNSKKERVIRYYYTDIIKYLPDNKIILNSGGRKTSTTKERISTFLPLNYSVFQFYDVWIVQKRSHPITLWLFKDNMIIDLNNGTCDTPLLQDVYPNLYLKIKGITKYNNPQEYMRIKKIDPNSEEGKKIQGQYLRRKIEESINGG